MVNAIILANRLTKQSKKVNWENSGNVSFENQHR
jgi:hypothetical protein